MKSEKTITQAFPNNNSSQTNGMLLIDYLAAKIAQGMFSNKYIDEITGKQVAEHSYKVADMMLQERKKYI